MPSYTESSNKPSTRKMGDQIVGGGREVGAALARQIGVRSPQQLIAGTVAQTPAASLARRITGQASGKKQEAVARQLQRWAKGTRDVTTPELNKLLSDFPGAASSVPVLGQLQQQLAGKVRPPLALPARASLKIRCVGTSRFQSGAGQPEIRPNHGATFSVENDQGDLTQREINMALGDPIGYWLDKFQEPAEGIEYLSIDSLEITASW